MKRRSFLKGLIGGLIAAPAVAKAAAKLKPSDLNQLNFNHGDGKITYKKVMNTKKILETQEKEFMGFKWIVHNDLQMEKLVKDQARAFRRKTDETIVGALK